MTSSSHPTPVRKPFFTSGIFILLGIMAVGFSFGLARFFSGLGAVTNLDNHYAWGIWKSINVAVGIALAASGFTAAALIDIFGRKKFHSLLRPAILTAFLGYVMAAISLVFDLGRYWNIWRPIFNWQGNSVLFEVAMCVMAYLFVLSFELSPSLLEGLKARMNTNEWGARVLKRIEGPIATIHNWVKILLPIFIIAGFVLSCMHHSSLGTLMLIAPTKLSTLWFTPLLPLLFLISAMMVGFPMIIMESILASRTFKYKLNMNVVSSLAAIVPWIAGLYLALKLGDLAFRWDQLNFLVHPNLTVSLAIEIIAGLLIPIFLLSFRAVRRSPGLLLFSVLLIIGGVVLNRLNTYLVGFYSPFAKNSYFPSIGEMAMTLALVSTIIFCYRFFVSFFPVLPAQQLDKGTEEIVGTDEDEDDDYAISGKLSPFSVWTVRAVGFVILFLFVSLYSIVHKEALAGEQFTPPEWQAKKMDDATIEAALAFKHESRPLEYRNLYMLNNHSLNSGTDYYEPVRFSHRTHDVGAGSDCSVCHHRVSADPGDRIGEDLKEMHASIEVRIGGACSDCHADLKEKRFQKCSACHGSTNEPDYPSRIGLKGAYHRQCIGCHREQPATSAAPADCRTCHHPLTPDHKQLVMLPAKADVRQVTAQCLQCHPAVGEDIRKSAHWNWKGLTPSIAGHEHSADTGLMKVMDNYTLTMIPGLVPSLGFHIGYGADKEADKSDFKDPLTIDCLVCHDTTANYKKDKNNNGFPMAGTDLRALAVKVGRPSRANCGSCHFYVGGGANVKHGDLEPALVNPKSEMDVHMGMVDMRCQDCHRTENHRIAGMSFMAPVTEGRVTCETCHGSQPHSITGYLSRHLDDHVKALSCETCHIPSFAQETPTRLSTDYSQAGQYRPPAMDALGMPLYDKNLGALTWGKHVAPVYRWFDGTRKTYVLGDRINNLDLVELNAPLGEKYIPESRIFPFKVHSARQPYDTEQQVLLPVKFENGYWQHYDWDRAIKEGTAAVGMAYSGKFDFVSTRMYTSLHHEVVPASQALGCSDCHKKEAITCTRCHEKAVGMDLPSHTRMVYPGVKGRMDFKALGYEGDPAIIGGRLFKKMGRGNPPR
jgi:octaheme c-type cytochrome (tetrathionate reductase family)